jgi:hypothetical protein
MSWMTRLSSGDRPMVKEGSGPLVLGTGEGVDNLGFLLLNGTGT